MSDSAGVTVPARELRLLLGGLRNWYSREGAPEGPRSGLEPREPACLGVVSGESGTGKSLLVQSLGEVCSKLGVRHACAKCFREQGEPLEVVLDLLYDLFARAPDSAAGLSPLQRGLLSELVHGREAGDDLPPVPRLSPELDASRRIDLLAETLLIFAEDAPLVLAVEELQWIDTLSAEVLASFLRMVRRRRRGEKGVPGLLMVTFRPAQVAAARACHEILHSPELAFEISCRGYSRDDLRDLCEGLGLDGVALSAREEVLQKTGGNTRVSRWFLRCLRELGGGPEALSELLGRHGRRVDFERLVHDRHDALDSPDRALVDTLSFLARPLGAEDLSGLIGRMGPQILGAEFEGLALDGDELARACVRMEAEGWLSLASNGSGEGLWKLDGQDVQEALQKRWPEALRARAHGEIARHFLENRAWEEDASDLFSALYHLQRAEHSGALVEVTRRAASLCEARQAHERAVEIRDRLLDDLDRLEPELLLELCLAQASALCRAGVHREAVDIYQSVLSGRLGTLSPEDRSECHERLGEVYRQLGEDSQELQAYAQGLQCVDEDECPIRVLSLHARSAEALLKRGEQDEAAGHLQRFPELLEWIAERSGGDGEASGGVDEVLTRLEEIYFRLGRHEEAEVLQKQLLDSAVAREDLELRVRSLDHLANLAHLRGDTDAAIRYLEQGLEGARSLSSRWLEARIRRQSSRLHRARGDRESALRDGYAFCEAMLEIGRESATPPVWGEVACVELEGFALGPALDALASYVRLRRAAATCESGDSPPANPGLFFPHYASRNERDSRIRRLRRQLEQGPADAVGLELADLLADAGQSSEAGGLYRRCLKSPGVRRNPHSLVESLQRLGRWHFHRGDPATALRSFERSLKYLESVLDRPLLGNAYLEVGQILTAQGNLSSAHSCLVRGLGVFLELSDPAGVCAGLLGLAAFLRDAGRGEWREPLARLVLRIASDTDSPRWEAEALLLAAPAVAERDDGEAGSMFARAGAIFQGLGLGAKTCRLDIELGWRSVRQRDFLRAERHAKSSLEAARDLRSGLLLQDSLHLLGVVESALAKRGKNFLRSLDVFQRALQLTRESRRVLATRWVLASMARLYGERGKADLSREFLDKELALARRVRGRVPDELWESFRGEALRRVGSNEGEFAIASQTAVT